MWFLYNLKIFHGKALPPNPSYQVGIQHKTKISSPKKPKVFITDATDGTMLTGICLAFFRLPTSEQTQINEENFAKVCQW